MKYKVGDIVRTTKDRDKYGVKLFPIGTIGTITHIDEDTEKKLPYKVETTHEYWFYSEDMLELVENAKTYEQGLNDAWELAQRINCYADEGGISQGELMKIFDSGDTCKIMCLSYEEALAKLKAYEDSKIEVGDVVVHGGDTVFVVTKIGGMIMGYDKIGDIHSFCFPNQLIKKTGKHIDIQQLLDSIGE